MTRLEQALLRLERAVARLEAAAGRDPAPVDDALPIAEIAARVEAALARIGQVIGDEG